MLRVKVQKSTSWAVVIYAFLLILSAYWAYENAGSMVSLYSGASFGILLLIAAILMFCGIKFGSYAALFLTFMLTTTFTVRYIITHKGFPAVFSLISAAILVLLIAKTIDWKR